MAEAHHDVPGELPEIRDEAAETPMWVPGLGLALLLLGAFFLVWQSATAPDPAAEEGAVEIQADDGAEPAPDAPAEAAPAEAAQDHPHPH